MLFSTIGTFGRVLCILFFACLSIAGVTSLVANMELVTHTLYDFGGTTVCIILIWIHFAIECVLPCFCFIIKISVDFLVVPRKFGMPCTVVLTFLGGLASALNLDILTNQVHLLFWFEILSTYTSLRTWNYHLACMLTILSINRFEHVLLSIFRRYSIQSINLSIFRISFGVLLWWSTVSCSK